VSAHRAASRVRWRRAAPALDPVRCAQLRNCQVNVDRPGVSHSIDRDRTSARRRRAAPGERAEGRRHRRSVDRWWNDPARWPEGPLAVARTVAPTQPAGWRRVQGDSCGSSIANCNSTVGRNKRNQSDDSTRKLIAACPSVDARVLGKALDFAGISSAKGAQKSSSVRPAR
jgi:hypothetical protein